MQSLSEYKRVATQTPEKAAQEYFKMKQERDKWKDEYENLCRFATDYENQCVALKAENERLLIRIRELESELQKRN